MYNISSILLNYISYNTGLLFPGGGGDITSQNTFTIAAEHLYNLALQANQQGDFFPIWVCLDNYYNQCTSIWCSFDLRPFLMM